MFCPIAEASETRGRQLVDELRAIRQGWQDKIKARRDSAAWQLADLLVRQPVVDAALVRGHHRTRRVRRARWPERLSSLLPMTQDIGSQDAATRSSGANTCTRSQVARWIGQRCFPRRNARAHCLSCAVIVPGPDRDNSIATDAATPLDTRSLMILAMLPVNSGSGSAGMSSIGTMVRSSRIRP